ncbi:GNAT family N-acetyltransferase [Reinekea thalattae]|uniref:GNAT family N-acetyltransferase n=1 Tax=Reinekea thalattae TaxID=2593301 RepID=A0A5C8Z9Y6_9GAMM|nr:GNAT family N-acetyltransferase [Reinekea thalattae]TXR54089.1 GNAT family N-acetyltransferase [Reinekea thalattae]
MNDSTDLKLCNIDPCYAEDVYHAIVENRSYLAQWLPWVERTHSIEDTRLFLAHSKHKHSQKKQFITLIYLAQRFIGITGFTHLDSNKQHGELGYWLIESAQHQGHMTHATQQLVRIGFEHLNLEKQIIRVATKNLASTSLAQHLGFEYQGLEPLPIYINQKPFELAVYSLNKTQWQHAEK